MYFGAGDEGTPIHYAVLRGHVEVMKMLLQNRADPNTKDIDNESVLCYAARNAHVR